MAPFLKICYHMTHPTINFNKMGLLGPTSTTDDDVCNARMPAASYTIYIHLEWGNK